MTLKRSALILLACGALVGAGCGGDDDNSSNGSSSTPAATTPAATTPSTTATTPSSGSANSANPNVQAAVEACQASVNNNAQLSADAKKDLQNICKDAASGDEQKVKEATKKVCKRIVEETGISGPAADQAKAACDSATK